MNDTKATEWAEAGNDAADVSDLLATHPVDKARSLTDYENTDPVERNNTRATFALAAVGVYAQVTRSDDEHPATAIGDLLSDLRHLADALGLDFTDLDDSSDRRYTEEVNGEL